MLIFTLKNERQSLQKRYETGPVEFGRGPERELPRVIVEDRYTSRDQLRIEELPTGDVRVTNLGGDITVNDGTQIKSNEARTLIAPTQLHFGFTTLQVGVIPKEDDGFSSSLRTIARASKPAEQAALAPRLRAGSEAPTPEVLTQWFETLLTVQKAAAGSDEFYQETARAVVELVGLERGMVLLDRQGSWRVVARHSTTEKHSDKFSRRVIDEVTRNRSTYYQSFGDSQQHEGSLQMVDAVVASPIFDQDERVVGVVYGSRDLRTQLASGRRGIQPLEAQLVQVLAGAVSAGLARVDREAEAARARVQFEQFVSPQLAQALERDAGVLAAQERELTLLFADLRGFSRIAERIGAEETYHLLSDILDRLTNQIMDHGGVVIDYYGDGLAAMWNAPFDQPDHALRAVNAAQAMQDELPAINLTWAERLGGVIRIGIGINSGNSQVGNSGSRRRMKYGPRGHQVNLCSRVEAATKILGVPCLVTESTRRCLDEDVPVRRIGPVRLTGMLGAVQLYELPSADPPEEWFRRRDLYEEALALYEQDRPTECQAALRRLLEQEHAGDVPAQRLLDRVAERLARADEPFVPILPVETK